MAKQVIPCRLVALSHIEFVLLHSHIFLGGLHTGGVKQIVSSNFLGKTYIIPNPPPPPNFLNGFTLFTEMVPGESISAEFRISSELSHA
jgi:hypothetical protein